VTGILGLIAVAISVQSILSPFVVAGLALFFLYPYRRHALVGRSMTLMLVLLGLWIFVTLFGILIPFLIAYLLAYMLNPPVTRLARRGIPRWAASLGLILLLLGMVTTAAVYLLPVILVQFEGILQGIRTLVSDATAWLYSGEFAAVLQSYGIPVESVRQTLTSELFPRLEGMIRSLLEGMLGLLSGISAVALQIVNAIIIPFITFYLLKDFPQIGERFYRLFPRDRQVQVRDVIGKIDAVLGRYFRGAVIVAIIQGTLSTLVLSLIGVKYAIVLGLMTAVLNFIPYVGLVISLVVSAVVALFSGGPVLSKVIGVVILYLGQKLLEATVLSPKIIGLQVGLHPVVLILCLMVFGYFLGLVGMLIAVPVTALLLMAWDSWEAKRDRET
jgi:predicted PurR-regulated permease PerM